jgi:tetratricopeptide (TPR) repeat protein
MELIETVSFLSDVKSITDLRNVFKSDESKWKVTLNDIETIIEKTYNKFNEPFKNAEFSDIVIDPNFIKELKASASKVINDMTLITIEIFPKCGNYTDILKKQLHEQIEKDLCKHSPFYAKLLELSDLKSIKTTGENTNKTVEKTYTAVEEIKEGVQTLLKQTSSNPSPVTIKEAYLPSSFHKTNIDVVGRETDIYTIHNAFEKDNIIALHGDGGIGKTITAEYYAEKYKEEYKTINHLQFSGSVQNTLMSLVEEWELKSFDGLSYEDRWNIIKNKLKNLNYNILIVIHINDESITQFTDYENLKYGKNVKFLVTTRVKKLPPCRMIEIETLSDDEIKQIFINNACDKAYRAVIEKEIGEHKEQFDEIVKIYSKNTMIITLAARIKNAANKNIAELCELIKEDSLVSTETTNVEITKDSELPDVFPIKEHIKKLYSIANLSEEQVDFLRNMSLMDYGGVPLVKFNEWMELTDNNTEMSLENNGFIHYDFDSDGKKIIYMHPAVSDAVFEQTGASSETCEKFLTHLYENEQKVSYNYENYHLISIVVFIIERLLNEKTVIMFQFIALAENYNNSARYFNEALSLYSKGMDVFNDYLGNKYQKSPNSMDSDNNAKDHNEKLLNALAFFKSDLEILERISMDESRENGDLCDTLGFVYSEFGENENALESYIKALNIYIKVLGVEHLRIANAYSKVAVAYNKIGNQTQALNYHSKALDINIKVLGKEHYETAISYMYIGNVYNYKGELKNAIVNYTKSLSIHENVLGNTHLRTIMLYKILATGYEIMDNYEKAAEYRQKAEQAQAARDKELSGV